MESKLLARILLKPDLVQGVPDEALGGSGPEASALRAVAEGLRAAPGLNHGQALALFEHSEHWPIVEDALAEPLLHQAEGDLDLESEVSDLVEKLRGQHQARRSAELLRLLQAETATPEQRAEYQALQAQLASAKSGNPAVESRSKP